MVRSLAMAGDEAARRAMEEAISGSSATDDPLRALQGATNVSFYESLPSESLGRTDQ